MSNIEKLKSRLQSIDVTKIVEYERKVNEIATINKMMAPVYLRDFINAYDIANSMYASAVRCDIEAKSALEMAESIAYLDRAGDYLKSKDIKDTADARKKYVDIDPDVQDAKQMRAKTEALVTFLRGKIQKFRMSHDDVKKMVYGDNYMSPEEGF